MKNSKTLSELIRHLQQKIQEDGLTSSVLTGAIDVLVGLGYKEYNLEKFPTLQNTSSFDGSVGDSPANLAEALLWKLGKWPAYKTFVQNYNNRELKVSDNGGVVFSAFAKHLQDNENPIYDQHAIRALWAICDFTSDDAVKCKKLLFNGAGNWKDAGSGDKQGSCYEVFLKFVKSLCQRNVIANQELDRLLMPLGQAIKQESAKNGRKDLTSSRTDYDRFVELCWSN